MNLPVSTDILVAIIAAVGLISVALISNRSRQHSKATRIQMENNHRDSEGNVINFREENDRYQNVLVDLMKGIQAEMRGLRRDNSRLEKRFNKHLDDTVPRKSSTKKEE